MPEAAKRRRFKAQERFIDAVTAARDNAAAAEVRELGDSLKALDCLKFSQAFLDLAFKMAQAPLTCHIGASHLHPINCKLVAVSHPREDTATMIKRQMALDDLVQEFKLEYGLCKSEELEKELPEYRTKALYEMRAEVFGS